MSISVHFHHPTNRILALLIGIFTFLIVVFGGSFSSMWDLWQTSDHRHGLLVFPISAFLIWRKRHELVGVSVIAEPRGLLLVVGSISFTVPLFHFSVTHGLDCLRYLRCDYRKFFILFLGLCYLVILVPQAMKNVGRNIIIEY